MKNIFIENLYANCDGETILRPFSKKLKLIISLDQQSEIYTVCVYCMSKSKTTKIC